MSKSPNTHPDDGPDKPEVFYADARYADPVGPAAPLSESEAEAFSEIAKSAEGGSLFEAYDKLTTAQKYLIELVQIIAEGEATDSDREDDESSFGETLDEIYENFSLVLQDMQQFCQTEAEFMSVASQLICTHLSELSEASAELFADEDRDIFPKIKLKKVIKHTSRIATRSDNPEALIDNLVRYTVNVYEDLKKEIFREAKFVQQERDVAEMKRMLAEIHYKLFGGSSGDE